jgi:hypothetical protein
MRPLIFAGLALAAPLAFSTPASASSDSTCYPNWKVKQTQMNGCSSMALLSPGNDTRINLLMLLNDQHGDVGLASAFSYNAAERRGDAQPFSYSIFGPALGRGIDVSTPDPANLGTICVSNTQGHAEFIEAVTSAKGLSSKERDALISARKILQPECRDGQDMRVVTTDAVKDVSGKSAQPFVDYLMAAASFYDEDFEAAGQIFDKVKTSGSGWVKEAATYMAARNRLNAAMQTAFDEWGAVKEGGIDRATVEPAERGFRDYLKAYPKGQYAASAAGLLRRVYWISNDKDKLLAEYVSAFKRKNLDGANMSLADLVNEMDTKLGSEFDPAKVNDPHIVAMALLQKMRGSGVRGQKLMARSAIEAQRGKFAGQEPLYNYLLAAHALYVSNNADAALAVLPANAVGDGYLAYSQRALRALALDAKRDAGARAAIIATMETAQKPFQRGAMELALAMHDERNGGLERVFAAGSPVKDADVREMLIRYSAGPKLLREQAFAKGAAKQERDTAMYTLLYKQLTRGAYKDFLADLGTVPAGVKAFAKDNYTDPAYTNIGVFKWAGTKDGYACPSLRTLATALAAAPKDAPSLLCLGEFVRLNDLDPSAGWSFSIPAMLDYQPAKDELGGAPSLFKGEPFSRQSAYQSVLANPAADANSKAYALYRAVNCYAPAGYNSCGGTDVDKNQRKAWFNQLKKSYPTSPWATQLKYYW